MLIEFVSCVAHCWREQSYL